MSARWTLITLLLAPAVVIPLLVPLYDQDGPGALRLPVLLLVPAGAHPVAVLVTSCLPPVAYGIARERVGATMNDVSTVAFSVFIFLFLARHRPRLRGGAVAQGQRAGQPRRVGSGRPRLRHLHRLVPHRRRPLHGLHVRRGAGAALRRQRDRLLRGALHDRGLPADLPVPAAALVGEPPARLRDAGRLRRGPLRQQAASRWPSPSPASSRRCPTSPCSWSASRSSCRSWASARRTPTGSSGTCRCSSPSPCWRRTPTRRDCGRRR